MIIVHVPSEQPMACGAASLQSWGGRVASVGTDIPLGPFSTIHRYAGVQNCSDQHRKFLDELINDSGKVLGKLCSNEALAPTQMWGWDGDALTAGGSPNTAADCDGHSGTQDPDPPGS